MDQPNQLLPWDFLDGCALCVFPQAVDRYVDGAMQEDGIT
jgi:hypothetical protein